jgi:S1-C subfamily serine protease
MEPTSSYRPRVSRETRLLLTAGLLAITVLWLLARVRFRDRPSPPSAIPAVLSQLNTGPKLDDLAAEISDLSGRLAPWLVAMRRPAGTPASSQPQWVAGLRYRDDVAVTLLPVGSSAGDSGVVALDRASGVALSRTLGRAVGTPPRPWTPQEPLAPRYLVATDVSPAGVSLRPAFIGSFDTIASPLVPAPVWALPAGSDLPLGAILFTTNAELVGMVISSGGQRAIVPAATLLAEAARLLAQPQQPAGTLGIEVQALTPPLASATGASAGVVLTWIDGAAASRGRLRVGDVIEAVDGVPLVNDADWDVRMARLSAGNTVRLRGRSRGATVEATLVASPAAPPATRTIGLTLRARPRTGAEVIRLQPGSAGQRAGLAEGDVITLFGEHLAPPPLRVTRSFAAMQEGQKVIVGVSRGDARFVTVVER